MLQIDNIMDLEELFTDVQMSRIFPDSKTFTDAVPKVSIEKLLAAYRTANLQPGFDLPDFIQQYFDLPEEQDNNPVSDTNRSAEAYCIELWDVLTRTSAQAAGTKICLPEKFIIPGGRFREFFYWDSYFTMLGLQASGRVDLIISMIQNFGWLIDTYGHIPNGTRTYFLSRSQPPFFSLMVELLSEEIGETAYNQYATQLLTEYHFWMKGADRVSSKAPAYGHLVRLPDGELLNRYWDDLNTPRPEGYYEDAITYQGVPVEKRSSFYRNIRAACESGWDFSGRWFGGDDQFSGIRTTDLLPVDLNCLLWHLEETLMKCYALKQDAAQEAAFRQKADDRFTAIQKYLWHQGEHCYLDYDFQAGDSSFYPTMAMAFPLFMKLASQQQAAHILERIGRDFLKPGGLLTSTRNTGQQWDGPNGWAPLQWVGYKAALNYGYDDLATTIGKRWTGNVARIFKATGRMMEKYNVVDTSLPAGGGEYKSQDGFGWTNGVYLKLLSEHF